MSIKITFGLLLVLLTTAFGVNFSEKYGRKRNFYIALENFCTYLKREISFSSTPVGNVVKSFSSDNEDLPAVLSRFAESGGSSEEGLPIYLNEEDKKFIFSFFSKLGKSDRQNELELVSAFSEEVKKYREAENRKYEKIKGLSAKLGFFAGAVIFVVLL